MIRRLAFALLLIGSGLAAGLVLTGRMRSATDGTAASQNVAGTAGVQSPTATVARNLAGLPDLSGVAAQAVRGVVNISSVQIVQRRTLTPFEADPFFRQFFGDPDELFGPRSRREMSLGSGVIVSPDGYVVTNHHVVGDNVGSITVSLGDKRELPARIVGVDPQTDIAVVKLDVANLPALQWGDSSTLKVGQWMLAIGSPFQLNQTVTLGIVSALGRANVGVTEYEDFIQTDAAINPGNSGGALVNTRGELVGINTAILSQSGGYQGVGFAVPSNLARRVMQDLIRYRQVRRGSFGYFEVGPVTTRVVDEVGLASTSGAVIYRMARNSEAYRAGLQFGDVIVSFNGTTVTDPAHLIRLVGDAEIGSTAQVTVVRNRRTIELRIPIVQQRER